MLKILKSPSGLAYLLLALLQLMVISQYELFVDEAFYWLEGQHLAWSYAELPGWTAWVLAFSEWLFPHHPAFLRILPWLAALSTPWLAIAITQIIHPEKEVHKNFGLIWALPLTALVATLALPDVWLLFFAFLTVWLTLLALTKFHTKYFIALGIVLALGLNVHVRFWIFAFILACCCLTIYRHQHSLIKKLLTTTLPLSLLGLLPIVIFNVANDFPLLNFQFKDRHPWSFQLNHLWFFLIQVLVTTPIVFILWCSGVKKLSAWNQLNIKQKTIVLSATLHWLVYAVLGFFSDTLRLNLHWPLLSYGLVLTAFYWPEKSLYLWAKRTGLAVHAVVLLLFLYWHFDPQVSAAEQRITQHASGWKSLTADTTKLMKTHGKNHIIADQFMTAAQLSYAYNNSENITVLAHPLNKKHGRSPQLAIMDMQQKGEASKHDLIVIEQTALKLEDQIGFFIQACQSLGGLKWLAQTDIQDGNKSFHFFEATAGSCDLPVIFYGDQNTAGWVVSKKDSIESINIAQSHKTLKTRNGNFAGNDMFQALDPETYQLTYFSCPDCTAESYQVEVTFKNGQKQSSQRFYP